MSSQEFVDALNKKVEKLPLAKASWEVQYEQGFKDAMKEVQKLLVDFVVVPKQKLQRLCDLWVAHIEPIDHQLPSPYYFQLVLTREEKTEFASILYFFRYGKEPPKQANLKELLGSKEEEEKAKLT